jgi:predicted RNA-binding protein with RPS1 domain
MDLGPVGDGQQFVGQVLHFKVLDVSEKGRRVVLSRKALLKNERAHQAEEVRGKLEPGQVMEGVVTRLLPFGAFVDVGGVQGLVHVSEISHKRVGDPSEALTVSQKVMVKVLKLEHLGEGKKERISLSIKAAEADPWTTLEGKLKEGDIVKGPVLRVMDFGAFVELFPGIDGLVHVSQLARRRIAHPRDVVTVGQEVEAKVTKIDPAAKRISLSMAALETPVAGDVADLSQGSMWDEAAGGGAAGASAAANAAASAANADAAACAAVAAVVVAAPVAAAGAAAGTAVAVTAAITAAAVVAACVVVAAAAVVDALRTVRSAGNRGARSAATDRPRTASSPRRSGARARSRKRTSSRRCRWSTTRPISSEPCPVSGTTVRSVWTWSSSASAPSVPASSWSRSPLPTNAS